MAPFRRPSLEDLFAPLVAATVVAFACGSSSVPAITRVGHSVRWALLAALLVAAFAAQVRLRTLPLRRPAVCGAALVVLALVSAAWSVDPRISAERAISLGLLFGVCVLLASGHR